MIKVCTKKSVRMALRKTEFRCRLTVDWIHWIILQVINTFGRFGDDICTLEM